MFRYNVECMGTGFLFQIEEENDSHGLSELCKSAHEVLQDADEKFSLYKQNSEIMQLLRNEISWDDASDQQRFVLEEVQRWHHLTSGFFDAKPHTPNYDPSGYVKTWATLNAAHYLLANGVRKFTINAGGDVYLSDELDSPLLNRVGLSNLRAISDKNSGSNLVVDLAGKSFRAVATSGVSERGEHIWRKDEKAAFIQVSVIGPDLLEADIWATSIISGGFPAWDAFLKATAGKLVAIAFANDGSLFGSPGFSSVLANV